MKKKNRDIRGIGAPWRRVFSAGLAVAGGMLLGACDLEVENPTMIEDVDLDDPLAIPALAAGVAGDFAYGTVVPGGGGLYVAGAMLTDEMVHVGTWVGLRGLSDGLYRNDWVESQSRWAEPSQARWTAENAVERISRNVENPGSNPFVAQVTMWAGHANRVMGDSFCHAVINGGPLESHTAFYDRAEGYFTDAISVAGAAGTEDVRLSAIGGRAHTRMMMGDWAGAVADAGQIPTNFIFHQVHSSNSSRENNDWFWWGNRRNETSVWGTPFAEWGMNLDEPEAGGDPRVPYDIASDVGGDGRRPFYRQLKFTSYDEDIAVVRGTEMRLIEAEAALRSGDLVTMVAKINEVRQYHNDVNGFSLPMLSAVEVTAGGMEQAWTILMKERGLELWLEGKRLPDVRRWMDDPGFVPFSVVREENRGQPASADPRLNILDTEVVQQVGDLCIAVSKNEIESNPNIPTS